MCVCVCTHTELMMKMQVRNLQYAYTLKKMCCQRCLTITLIEVKIPKLLFPFKSNRFKLDFLISWLFKNKFPSIAILSKICLNIIIQVMYIHTFHKCKFFVGFFFFCLFFFLINQILEIHWYIE